MPILDLLVFSINQIFKIFIVSSTSILLIFSQINILRGKIYLSSSSSKSGPSGPSGNSGGPGGSDGKKPSGGIVGKFFVPKISIFPKKSRLILEHKKYGAVNLGDSTPENARMNEVINEIRDLREGIAKTVKNIGKDIK